MFRRKGCQVENQGHTYRCPQQHDICLLQGAWDAICPHVPSGFPVKHQGKDPKGEDGSSKAEGFPATLSPVAKYFLGKNQNKYKYWLSTINNKWTNGNFADETGVGTCRVWRSWKVEGRTEEQSVGLRKWRKIPDKNSSQAVTSDFQGVVFQLKKFDFYNFSTWLPWAEHFTTWSITLLKSPKHPLNRIIWPSLHKWWGWAQKGWM